MMLRVKVHTQCISLIDIYVRILFINVVSAVILTTKQGILKGGIEKSRGGRSFYSFYGIPFAEPPVGELRFKVRDKLCTYICIL